jgi:hypothetical protein
LFITNSTFYQNSANAVYSNKGPLTINNSTFAYNVGFGVTTYGNTLTINNSILANNGTDCFNSGSVVFSFANNLTRNGNCGKSLISADPLLGPLTNNGGLTQTMALLPGSPAIDRGNDATCATTDQRGVSRPYGAHCDIGAYEFSSSITPTSVPSKTPTSTSTPTPTNTPTITPTSTSWVTVTAPNGGEVLSYGDTYHITWQSSPDIEMVDVVVGSRYTCASCSPYGEVEWGISLIPNTGSYDWTVYVDDPTNKEFVVVILGKHFDGSAYNVVAMDGSDNPFNVVLSGIPTLTRTPTAIITPTVTPTQTVSPTPTASPTSTVTLTPTLTPTQTKTATPTFTKTPTPTITPTPVGAGLFEPYINYPVGDGEATGIADFNNDGLLDVALVIPNQLLIFLQKSDGTLNSPVAYPALSSPISLAVGDLNNDGRTDIVALFNPSDAISIYLQQADGTLAARIEYPTSSDPDSVAVGDVNGDGLADVAVSHWTVGNIGIFTQNVGGTLNPMITYTSPRAGRDDIAIGDINGDGRNDVVKMNGQGLNPNLSVYTQNTDGTLANAVSYQLGFNCLSQGLGIGDLTGDGLADVVISYGGNRPESNIAVFAQAGDGTLQSPVSYSAYDIPSPVEIVDVNSDGLADVLVINSGWNTLSVYLQQSDGALHTYSRYTIPYASYYQPQGLAVGDINHDGLPDVAIADYNHGLVILYHKPLPVPTSTPTYMP